jgi:integrase
MVFLCADRAVRFVWRKDTAKRLQADVSDKPRSGAGKQWSCRRRRLLADPTLVFPNTRGKIRRRDSVMSLLRRYLEEAGLPVEIRFHDLRHTAGTLALRQGVPLHTVSRMLGHSDPAMTLRRYAHVLEDMREDAARAMDDLF